MADRNKKVIMATPGSNLPLKPVGQYYAGYSDAEFKPMPRREGFTGAVTDAVESCHAAARGRTTGGSATQDQQRRQCAFDAGRVFGGVLRRLNPF